MPTRFLAITAHTLRITHTPEGEPFPADPVWLADVLLPQPPLTERPTLEGAVVDGRVRVTQAAGQVVLAEVAPPELRRRHRRRAVALDLPAVTIRGEAERSDAGVRLTFRLAPGEGLYGFGEWFNAFRRERGALRLHNRDAIAPMQGGHTYSGMPVHFSSRGYGVWYLNAHPAAFNLDPERGTLTFTAAGPGADYVVIYGPSFAELIAAFTALTGRPPLVPRWALGLMVTGYPQEPQPVVTERVAEHRRRAIPLDAVILDYHWEERFHNFRWRRALFPEPERLIADLAGQAVRLGLIFTPFVNHRNRLRQRWLLQRLAANLPAGPWRADERALPEYAHALARGYFAHPNTLWWFGAGGMVDFTNPAAAAWWNGLLRPLYDRGIAFFKNDDGEYLPPDATSALGLSGPEHHNLYGFYYDRAIYTGMAALDDRRPFIYARSSGVGAQRYPALFLGDQKPTFAHMHATLRAGLNMGLLGFAHWTADVFGLDGRTTPELHRRYAQYALLAPIARYFWRPPALDDTRLPWSHGAANEANFRKFVELRYRLLPYYAQLGWEAHRTGLPVLRPMLLHAAGDDRMAAVDDQALLGDRLLLAPVLTPADPGTGVARRRVVLPAGPPWHDYWSTATYAGGGVADYAAAPDVLPLLVRGSSILPLGPLLQHIADSHRFTELALHCYPPYPASLVFYDDDGCTRAYARGEFSTTAIEVSAAGGVVRVSVRAAEGGYPTQPAVRTLVVVLHRQVSAPAAVEVSGATGSRACTVSHDPAAQTVAVAFEHPVIEATEVALAF
ncbi:MAG: glycoside hydrolase family 31 protein [Anaerolineales bacterium]|nr:glycoside hydrolase family 31 protein [Anaerolineales bacterium]